MVPVSFSSILYSPKNPVGTELLLTCPTERAWSSCSGLPTCADGGGRSGPLGPPGSYREARRALRRRRPPRQHGTGFPRQLHRPSPGYAPHTSRRTWGVLPASPCRPGAAWCRVPACGEDATRRANGGFAVTVPQALGNPNDYGVSSISLSSGGSGYLDAPLVTISGGSGSNATAIATVAERIQRRADSSPHNLSRDSTVGSYSVCLYFLDRPGVGCSRPPPALRRCGSTNRPR